jgi:hypothetical protein
MTRTFFGAGLAAVALAVTAVLQLTHEPSGESSLHGFTEHLLISLLSGTLLALVPVIGRLGRLGAPRLALVPIAGQVTLAALATVSNVRGADPSFFAAVAAPANLAILGGWIALAVVLRRRGAIPTWIAVALPLAYVGMIPASQAGGGLISAAIWLAFAAREASPAWTSRAAARPAAAA